MDDKNKETWDTFKRTGSVEAYLLYKSETKDKGKEDKESTWQMSEQEVLS